jgi:hypothetical protein
MFEMKVNFYINAKYRVASDSYNWILQEFKVVRKEYKWADVSYHGSLQQLLLSAVSRQIKDKECKDIQGYLEALETVENSLKIVIGKLDTIQLEKENKILDKPTD